MENERINPNIFQLNQIYLYLYEKSKKIISDPEVQRKFYTYERGYLNKRDPRTQDLAQRPGEGRWGSDLSSSIYPPWHSISLINTAHSEGRRASLHYRVRMRIFVLVLA